MNIKNSLCLALAVIALWSGAASSDVVNASDCSLRSWDTIRGSVTVNCNLTINNHEMTDAPAPAANPSAARVTIFAYYNNGDVGQISRFEATSLPPLPAGTTIADLVRMNLVSPTETINNRVLPLADVDSSGNSGNIRTEIRILWGTSYVISPMFNTPVNNVPLGCSLDAAGAPDMEFRHGMLVRTAGGGSDTVSANINLSCKIPTQVRISVLNRMDLPTNLKGVVSTLGIDGSNYTKVFGTVNGNLIIPVTSTLKWSSDSDVGPFTGSGIILLDIP